MKKPFVTKEQIEEIAKTYPTPFHIYDEKGIRETARALFKAFSWNKGFKEYFAVKATPNPFIMNILRSEGCGFDCSSYTELLLSGQVGAEGHEIMFSSNATPDDDFRLAYKMGALINLDDFTHIDVLDKLTGIPEFISCRYNPGGEFKTDGSPNVMDTPKDAKYGFTHDQLIEGYRILKEKGAKKFGMHAFLASNTLTNDYYPARGGGMQAKRLRNGRTRDVRVQNRRLVAQLVHRDGEQTRHRRLADAALTGHDGDHLFHIRMCVGRSQQALRLAACAVRTAVRAVAAARFTHN